MSVQIPVRIPREDAKKLDDAVARGRFANRSEALREGLALLLREEREREILDLHLRSATIGGRALRCEERLLGLLGERVRIDHVSSFRSLDS